MVSTASSYFMPNSIKAMATRTGARPNPATQCTATAGITQSPPDFESTWLLRTRSSQPSITYIGGLGISVN